jgi:VWFA-related protein
MHTKKTAVLKNPDGLYNHRMHVNPFRHAVRLSTAGLALAAGMALHAQTPAPATPAPAPPEPAKAPASTQPPQSSGQVIRRSFDVIRTDVIVRDQKGQFVADLKKDDFEVYEDGVKQEVVSFVLTHGGRTYNVAAPPPPPPQEGIILPPPRPANDAAGRIFIIFIDDLHLDFRNTPRIRKLFEQVSKELIHEGDMFGIVSTGPSSISIDLTYDRKRLKQASEKISGAGLRPKEILETPEGAEGPAEVRYRAHVAFSTAYEILQGLEQVHDRRKAFVYLSNGYDFNPFPDSRKKMESERWASMNPNSGNNSDDGSGNNNNEETNPFMTQKNVFSFADLAAELAELTRAANRANATLYTIDPRGLVGMADMDEPVDMVDWNNHVRQTQDTLRVLAELTGGIAVINQNDFTRALQRIDNETSDYYVVGYYSSNPDPKRRTRRIEVKVKREGLNLHHRTSYSMKLPPPPSEEKK